MKKSSLSSTLHSVLHAFMSKAVLEGKELTFNARIPLLELLEENGSQLSSEDAEGVLLRVEIKTSFEKGYSDTVTYELDDDNEELL